MKKRDGGVKLESWQDADQALRDLGLAQIAVERIEGTLAVKIAELKNWAEHCAAPHKAAAARLEDALERFWLAHRSELERKSWRGTYGAMGTRASRAVRLLRGWTAEKAALAVAGQGAVLSAYLRVKRWLDREAVLRCTDAVDREALRSCGLAIEEREKFFAEPDREKLAAAAADR